MEALCALQQHTSAWTSTAHMDMNCMTNVLSAHETGIHDANKQRGNSKNSYSTSLLCYWSVEWQGDFPVSVLNNATLTDWVNWLCEMNRLE